MKDWEQFEIDCADYLKIKFSDVTFTSMGGSDSTNSDILVEPPGGTQFYIEVKMVPAQCGQFVLLPDHNSRTFLYSSRKEENEFSEAIRLYMNRYFDSFSNANARGKNIELEESIFYGWIKNHYSSKNVKFVMTHKEHYTIIPLDMLEQYFIPRAKYRMKRSGTAHPSRNNKAEIVQLLDALKEKNGCDYQLEYGDSTSKTYVTIACDLKDKYISGTDYEYIFRKEGNRYFLRRRSNTTNSNVIFSITLKRKKLPQDEYFLRYLNTI